jgi:hypothetical protein
MWTYSLNCDIISHRGFAGRHLHLEERHVHICWLPLNFSLLAMDGWSRKKGDPAEVDRMPLGGKSKALTGHRG